MKLSYYTTLDGADPLPKLGALVHTRVEKPPLGPVLAGPTAREGIFSDAKGRLFTRFEENACAPVDGAKPGALNVHDSLYYGKRGDLTPDLSDAAIDAVCAAISAGPSRAEIKANPIGPKQSMREWEKAYYERVAAQKQQAWFEQQCLQQPPRLAARILAIGETCSREEIEDGYVVCPPEQQFSIDYSTGIVGRVA